MKRIAIVGLLIAFAIAGIHAPASATVTASSIVGPNPYTGSCPVNIASTGSITGTPGTVFTYSFNRFISGVQQVVNGGTVTMPNTGSFPVNDSIPISSTTSGVTFDQIWVHNILPAQGDVYSNRANFSVTCPSRPGVSEFDTNGGYSAKALIAAMAPAAPYAITTSGDPKACANHIANPLVAGLLCTPLAAGNKLFIVWNEKPDEDVDGFKIYRTDQGKSFVAQTSAGPGATVSVLDAPTGGFAGKCYTVTSYKGARESAPGAATCLAAAPSVGTTSVTLQPARTRSSQRVHEGSTGVFRGSLFNRPHRTGDYSFDNKLDVGYAYYTTKSWAGDDFGNYLSRGAALFNLGAIVSRPIWKATLHLHVTKTVAGDTSVLPPTVTTTKSCATELGVGRGQWWTNGDWIEADWFQNPSQAGPNVDVDVTQQVREWANGAPNNGFVLRGGSENTGAFTEDECETNYDATLTVEYFK